MYSKDKASHLKQAFWTAFGQYMAPIPSAEGLKTNWINYKTGIKHLHFRMQADNRMASIAIELSHPDKEIQQMMIEQLAALKTVLETTLGEKWDWEPHLTGDGDKIIGRVGKSISGVSIFYQRDWPVLISFFKPRIIALDEFWTDAKYNFDLYS